MGISSIKRLVKAGKSKSVVTHTGRTNAMNPSSLGKLAEAYEAMERANKVPMQTQGPAPIKRMPTIDQRYKDMGEVMGICPYELRDVMQAEIGEDQTLVFTLLKKFVTAAKLSGAVDFEPTKKELKATETRHTLNMNTWQAEGERLKVRNADIAKLTLEKKGEFDAAWSEILIDLVTKLQRNKDVKSLGAWDRLMVMAIAHTGEEFCAIEHDLAVLDFKACQRMAPDKIVGLPKVANVIHEHEEEVRWSTWLNRASIDQMVKKLWEMGVENDGSEEARRREQLEWLIIAKSGKTPVRDRWGNLNWNATFSETPVFEDDYSWEEERERQKIEAWKEALQRQRDKAIRVKSGRGTKSKSGV